MNFRALKESDLFSLMKLYQLSKTLNKDLLLTNYQELLQNFQREDTLWFCIEENQELVSAVCLLIDREQSLCRIHRFYTLDSFRDNDEFNSYFWTELLNSLQKEGLQVLYTVTKNLSSSQQKTSREKGFKLLGVFPNFHGEFLKLVGLTAYFFDGVLQKRYGNFFLHPKLENFFSILKKECTLNDLRIFDKPHYDLPQNRNIQLECIEAPQFVLDKFLSLKQKKVLSIHFYPFQLPNVLLTTSDEKIQIFARIFLDQNYAMIIGERLQTPVDPSHLYAQVSKLLRAKKISHIEMINDAADVLGIEAITRAGFIPCAYFPCLKKQEEQRRDYVVFSRCYEKILETDSFITEIYSVYQDYLLEFRRLEKEYYIF